MSLAPTHSEASDAEALINRLPDSILSDIFRLVQSASTWASHKRLNPYTLSGVSHRWRIVELSTSSLWDYVDALRRPIDQLKVHITRSGCVPMEVWIDIFYTNMNTNLLQQIFSELGDAIWVRSRRLGLMLDYERPGLSRLAIETINGVIDAGHTTVFEEIVIHVVFDSWDPDGADPDNSLCLHLPNSVALRKICLEQVDLSLQHLLDTPSLPLLQTLQLNRIDIDIRNILFPLLSLLPNLLKLSLDYCSFSLESSDQLPSERSVALSKLEKLKIRKCHTWYMLNSLFQSLHLPNLQILKLGILSLAIDPSFSFINWSIIFQNFEIKKLRLQDFGSATMSKMITQIHKFEKLEILELRSYSIRDPDDIAYQLVVKLLETTNCCAILRELQLPWTKRLDVTTLDAIKELKCERDSLHVYLGEDELEFSEEEDYSDDGDDSEIEASSEEEEDSSDENEDEPEEEGSVGNECDDSEEE